MSASPPTDSSRVHVIAGGRRLPAQILETSPRGLRLRVPAGMPATGSCRLQFSPPLHGRPPTLMDAEVLHRRTDVRGTLMAVRIRRVASRAGRPALEAFLRACLPEHLVRPERFAEGPGGCVYTPGGDSPSSTAPIAPRRRRVRPSLESVGPTAAETRQRSRQDPAAGLDTSTPRPAPARGSGRPAQVDEASAPPRRRADLDRYDTRPPQPRRQRQPSRSQERSDPPRRTAGVDLHLADTQPVEPRSRKEAVPAGPEPIFTGTGPGDGASTGPSVARPPAAALRRTFGVRLPLAVHEDGTLRSGVLYRASADGSRLLVATRTAPPPPDTPVELLLQISSMLRDERLFLCGWVTWSTATGDADVAILAVTLDERTGAKERGLLADGLHRERVVWGDRDDPGGDPKKDAAPAPGLPSRGVIQHLLRHPPGQGSPETGAAG